LSQVILILAVLASIRSLPSYLQSLPARPLGESTLSNFTTGTNNLSALLQGLAVSPAPAIQPKRHVFISRFHANEAEVNAFIYRWAHLEKLFTPRALGTFDSDDFIDSDNPEYVMAEIRRKYLMDASVTILLIGTCTHSRRYVDWELKSSLRRGENVPNGLIAYLLPSAIPPAYGLFGEPIEWGNRAWPSVPDRLAANWNYYQQDKCYARYSIMPNSAEALRDDIEAAFRARTNRAHLIQNDAEMMKRNSVCRACGVTHT
jgi:hypothetical protein